MKGGRVMLEQESVGLDDLKRIQSYRGLISVSPMFFERLEEFVKRNDLKSSKSGKIICARCFKAFFSRLTEEFSIPDPLRMFLLSTLDCETGHEGFYIDGNELKRVK